ncbi:hypothetical protein ABGB18_17395 [Nonomuraea sp. B12E4]|uniref:hypothetical protein n=1 Tax=Nonomuraea sp. B12E4 TaxID=3153564 RepID=UPI00325ECD19
MLRPKGTKAVDASILPARTLIPEPMRPGWAEALRMTASRIPHARLVDIDTRMELAAAKPVIIPEMIVCDRGSVFISDTFQRACQSLGISLQPTHPRSPAEKGSIERTFGSINTLFGQHVAGYVGSNPTRRGEAVEVVWTLMELQDLLDEWVVAGWQARPHEGLRHPWSPKLMLSPNEMFAALLPVTGYLPVTLTGEEKDEYERDKLDYHAQLVVVATPADRQIVHSGRRLTLLNRGQISARRGLMVTGGAGTGKTTAITQLWQTP